MSFEMQRSQQS